MARICMVSSVHAATDTRIFQREARALARAGHDVAVVAQHPADELVDGIRIHALPTPKHRAHRLAALGAAAFRVARRLRSDVYHLHDPELLPIGPLLGLLTRARIVFDVHEEFASVARNRAWIPRPLRPLAALSYRIAERLFLPLYSAVVTADGATAARCRRIHPHVVVVRNFSTAGPGPVPERAPRTGPAVVFDLGGISALRCAGEIVEAMELLPASLEARLDLGGHCESDSLRERLEGRSGWAHVDYLGPLPHEEALRRLREADVALVLYSPDPNHYEVRSNRLFESMAAGTPLVVSDFPAWRRFVEETGCGVVADPRDPEAIARAIASVLSDPERALRMGEAGLRASAGPYSGSAETARLVAAYAELLASEG